MTIIDPLGDMLTRIRNAQMRGLRKTATPASSLRKRVLDVLVEEGYINGYKETVDERGFKEYIIELKYFEGKPAIRKVSRVSTPGRRVYSSVGEIPQVANGLGVSIISTSKGVLPDYKAREANVGGEVLCQVF